MCSCVTLSVVIIVCDAIDASALAATQRSLMWRVAYASCRLLCVLFGFDYSRVFAACAPILFARSYFVRLDLGTLRNYPRSGNSYGYCVRAVAIIIHQSVRSPTFT